MDAYANFINGTITLFSDPMGILIFFGGVVGGMLFGAIPGGIKTDGELSSQGSAM